MSGVVRAQRIEAVEVERDAGAARHGDEMDDGIGRAAERQHGGNGIVEGRRR